MRQCGYFLGPTILDRVNDQMAVGREEIFGPVLSVARASTLEEAIDQADFQRGVDVLTAALAQLAR
jgi:acyl-CoA reductase-like NAD-dependent aldehyde dehydrogenase